MSSKEAATDVPDVAVAEPEQKRKPKPRKKPPRQQPRYHVILWNDNDHSYDYVVEMMQKLFGHPQEKGFLIAKEVDEQQRGLPLQALGLRETHERRRLETLQRVEQQRCPQQGRQDGERDPLRDGTRKAVRVPITPRTRQVTHKGCLASTSIF